MSRTIRKQILTTLETLEEANEVIAKLISDRQSEELIGLLTDCQDCAIAIGNQIDAIYPYAENSIRALENYCECIYQLAACPEDNEESEARYNNVCAQTTAVKETIEEEIEDKLEIVFMPYKASMWDSLESVYLAADKNESCDAYVVPIPYFDRQANDKLGEMHYEGNDYPKNIEVTDWQNYSFEERKPDVIYIHNPYDEWNNVTCVHPRFFSSNLKKYTEKLVYIPYFVLEEIKPDEQEKIDKMKHFCYLPGIVNADQVILQSEDMRQIYMNEYAKVLEKKGITVDKKKLEEKFLGTGSPKFDKVLNTKKEDLDVPKEWLKVIEKPDGTWKKIVFYNTSINALLQFDERMLVKMKSVFEIFKERQEDVALLWRPHPLIRATIESMRPQLWEKYRELVEQYKEEGWGIYDDTPDMDRAVVLSDAYYGDGSSVIPLCQKRDIPIMVQNPEAIPENSRSLAMDNIVEYQGEWWFLAFKDNGIYRMNPNTFEASLVARIPWKKGFNGAYIEYGEVYIYKDKLFIIPWCEGNIAVYDITKGNICYVECHGDLEDTTRKFVGGVQKENRLYLIPSKEKRIYIIDMESEEVTYLEMKKTSLEDVAENIYGAGSIYCENEYIWVAEKCDNKIVQINLNNGDVKEFQHELLEGGCIGICGDKDGLWIIPRKTTHILRWNRREKRAYTYDAFPEGYRAEEWSFHKAVLLDKLYLLPREANMMLAVNKADGNIEKLDIPFGDVGTSYYEKYLPYSCIWNMNGRTQVIHTEKGVIYDFINGDTNKIRICDEADIRLECEDELIYERANRFDSISNFISENM